MRHEFIVLAHGVSPHLQDCVGSLARQSLASRVRLSTSTPNPEMIALADERGIQVTPHTGRGIGADWNAALSLARAEFVTLAHQDDVYGPDFASASVDALDGEPSAAFCIVNGSEIDEAGKKLPGSATRAIKSLMVATAFLGTGTVRGGWRRRALLGFGNPVFCAGVTFRTSLVRNFRFREDMRTNLDWFAWLELSKSAAIVRPAGTHLRRRVHACSATSDCLADGSRRREDRQVFESLWPSPVARVLASLYRAAYQGYLQ